MKNTENKNRNKIITRNAAVTLSMALMLVLTACNDGEIKTKNEPMKNPMQMGTENADDNEEPGDALQGELITDQTFQADLAPLGEVTFSSYAPNTEKEPLADAVFTVSKSNGDVQFLDGIFPDNVRANESFNSVEAVSFPDYNSDGYNDIIVICNYSFASGPDAGTVHSEARIYSGNEAGQFKREIELSDSVNSALAEITVDSVLGFVVGGTYNGGNENTDGQDWKVAYEDFLWNTDLNEEGVDGYNLIYLDDDDIPELVEIGNCEASGARILSYYNGKVTRNYLNRLGFTYIERGNELCNSEGNMDVYYDDVYRLEAGELVTIASGTFGAIDNSNVQYDADGQPIYQYCWENVNMTKSDYEKALSQVYDSSKAVAGYSFEDYDSRDDMIKRLREM